MFEASLDLSQRPASDRYTFILEQAANQGHVAVRDLARRMAVSEATVRRDLRALAEQRRLELVYGGATLTRPEDQSFQARAERNREAKRTIGDLAAGLVGDHEMVFIDSGTTCFEMRHGLRSRRGLTGIVNSTRLAVELGKLPESHVLLLAGQFRPERQDTIGPLAANAIDQLRGYVAFIGADGLCPDFGISANEIQTAYLWQHVIRNARETVLLADQTKFEAPSLYRICGFDSVSKVVTDRLPSPEWAETFAREGIEIIVPPNPA